MIEIRNAEDLEKWLTGRSPIFSDVIAVRLSLRLCPLLGSGAEALTQLPSWRTSVTLPLFRIVLSSHTAQWSLFRPDLFLSRDRIDRVQNHASLTSGYLFDLISWIRALTVDQFLISSIRKSKDESILISVTKNLSLSRSEFQSIFSAISADCRVLERGVDLWTQPLWLNDTPEWAVRGWEILATELTKRAPYWKTLVRWYEDRRRGDDWAVSQGRPAIRELEIARASLPDSYWKKGGKAVNLAIAELEAFFWEDKPLQDPTLRDLVGQLGIITAGDSEPEQVALDEPAVSAPPVEDLPQQTPTAIQFDGRLDTPIDLAPPEATDLMSNTAGRREDYAELREKARDLLTQGANRLGRIKEPLDRFLSLSDDLSHVRAPLFWSRINTLRIDLADHDEAAKTLASISEPDERALDRIVAGKLRDVVETINLFVVSDPVLLGYDSQRLGPREVAGEVASIKLVTPVLKVALTNTVITVHEAAEIVIEQVDNATAAPATPAGRLATDLGSKTVGNYVSTLVRRGYVPLKPYIDWSGKGITEGALREIGKRLLDEGLPGVGRTAQEALVYISDNAQVLMHYTSEHFANPALQAIIELIHKMLS